MVVNSLFQGNTSLLFLIILQAITEGWAIPSLQDELQIRFEKYYNTLIPILIEAQEDGDAIPGDPTALAAGYFSLVQGLATLGFHRNGIEKKITPSILTNLLRNKA